jgi:hypothetical protein
VPFNNTTVNPCNGQPVAFSGVVHSTFHETARPNGGVNIVQNMDFSDVKGIDVSGNSYVGHEKSQDGVHVSAQGAVVVTFPISLGGSCRIFFG